MVLTVTNPVGRSHGCDRPVRCVAFCDRSDLKGVDIEFFATRRFLKERIMRLASTLALVIVTLVVGTTNADHHHKVWWKYLTGTRSFEHTTGDKGELTFSMAPTGDAMVGQWKNDDGSSAYDVDRNQKYHRGCSGGNDAWGDTGWRDLQW